MKPFAVLLYERFRNGETIEELAAALGIQPERIAARIRAAQTYARQQGENAVPSAG